MFKQVYSRLDCVTHEMGESYYNPLIPGVIEELEKKKLVEMGEDGPSKGAKVARESSHS